MTAPGPDRPAVLLDAGAQAERTALAWQRTGLAALVLGAVLVRVGPGVATGAVVLAGGAALTAVVAPLRYRAVLRAVGAGAAGAVPGLLAAVTLATLLVILAVVAVLPATGG